MFISTETITVTQASLSVTGYFRGVRGLELLIVENDGKRWAIHLNLGKEQFNFYEINEHWQEKGASFDKIRFEVDHSSMVDPDSQGELGDLMMSDGGLHIIAKQGSSFRGMAAAFALAGSQSEVKRPSIAFRRWRVVSGMLEQPATLWPADCAKE